MNILFHANQLCLRGTTIALYDYAHYAETLLGHKSFITYDAKSQFNHPVAHQRFQNRFPGRVQGWNDLKDLNVYANQVNADVAYFIKAGFNDGILCEGRKNVVHVVFQYDEPHGSVYAYVSDWLSVNCSKGRRPFVPHIVELPSANSNLRAEWGIPQDAFVFGRHGGADMFNLEFAQRAVNDIVTQSEKIWFVFYNTIRFSNHPRVKFLPYVEDPQAKSNFISSCDAMIHAGSMGESFGLAICEFLFHGKPVLAWKGGGGQHHAQLLKHTPWLYSDYDDLMAKAFKLAQTAPTPHVYRNIVRGFKPSIVMNVFSSIFLES